MTVDPNWPFVAGTFIMMILMSYGIVGLIIYLHNRNAKNRNGGATSDKKANIYYDELYKREAEEARIRWLRMCPCFGRKELKRIQEEREAREAQNRKKVEDDITYQDLEALLADFKYHMDLMKAKLKAGEEREANGEGDARDPDKDEDELLRELQELREFVNKNKLCIQDYFGIQDDGKKKGNANDAAGLGDLGLDENDLEMMNLLRQQQAREAELAAKMRAETMAGMNSCEAKQGTQNDSLREALRAKLAS